VSNVTQKLINRDIKARQETRRGTVLTDPRLLNYDTASINRSVFVVDVDIGATRPLRNVLVKSPVGAGGRGFAARGKAVEVQRNAGGRWIVVGASDRINSTSAVQLLDESNDTVSTGPPRGHTSIRRPFNYYSVHLSWGQRGFGDSIILDAEGNEVI